MDVEIGEVTSTVRAVDGDALLTPATLRRVVELVLRAIDDRESHGKRTAAERRVTGGVAEQQDEE